MIDYDVSNCVRRKENASLFAEVCDYLGVLCKQGES